MLACFAHPDDESFGPSGTLAKYGHSGCQIILLCATRGEEGKITDPVFATRETLGAVRELELRRAAKVLGVDELFFLGYRDKSLSNIEPIKIARKIIYYIRRFRPQVVMTYEENGISGHADHIAVSKAVNLAYSLSNDPNATSDPIDENLSCYQPPKLYHYGLSSFWKEKIGANRQMFFIPEKEITCQIDVEEYLSYREQAISCHKTQSFIFRRFQKIQPTEFIRMRTHETFQLSPLSQVKATNTETDLFEGLGVT
jgi:N-acetylglucosamine malate deacetylase 2